MWRNARSNARRSRSIRRAPICRRCCGRTISITTNTAKSVPPRPALWTADNLPFRIEFFHPGYLYQEPVHINEFTADAHAADPVRAGFFRLRQTAHRRTRFRRTPVTPAFRVLYPLNETNKWTNSARFSARAISGCSAKISVTACPRAGWRWIAAKRPAGGISHLHRLVAGQAAAQRHGTDVFRHSRQRELHGRV
jgi:hypothetical protein